jgi:epoxyqueuosine reductase
LAPEKGGESMDMLQATRSRKSISSLKDAIVTLAGERGIDKVGFTSRERLRDAPPSGDLAYVLPNARSAISLAVSLDKAAIRAYLGKEDQMAHVTDHKLSYIKLEEAGKAIEALLRDRGYEAWFSFPNMEYRKGPFMAMIPPLSHRYVALASGIGWLGWSGNVITPEYGATVSLASVVTSAELEPDPLAEGDFCQNCCLCAAVCPSHFISMKEQTMVTVAGRTHIHNKKASNLRCVVTCGGANGVRHPNAKWSTWSYKVLDLPGRGDEEAFERRVLEYTEEPHNRLLREVLELEKRDMRDWEQFDLFMKRLLLTCGNCMIICWPDRTDRKENYRLLTTSGRVVKGETAPQVVRV